MPIVRILAAVVFLFTALANPARADQITLATASGAWTYFGPGFNPNQFQSTLTSLSHNSASPVASSSQGRVVSMPITTPTSTANPVTPSAVSTPVTTSVPTETSATVAAPVHATETPVGVTPAASAATATAPADAAINFYGSTSTNLPEASLLTVGNAEPWYTSPAVLKAFGGTAPTSSQQSGFMNLVESDVQQTFSLAGLHPSITLSGTPGAANHTITIASGLSYGPIANAIGITDVGNNGYDFIDKLDYATTEQSLAWAVAHNVAHELMHAFGIAFHPADLDPATAPNYVDTGTATWGLLTNPTATFSPAAAALLATDIHNPATGDVMVGGEKLHVDGDEVLATTPEPSTLIGWAGVLGGAWFYRRAPWPRPNPR